MAVWLAYFDSFIYLLLFSEVMSHNGGGEWYEDRIGGYKLRIFIDNRGYVRKVLHNPRADTNKVRAALLREWGNWKHEIEICPWG